MEFVAEGEEDQRGVVAIGLENALRLIANPCHAACVAGLAEVAGPERQLGLDVDALLVGRRETSLRRAVGVEAKVVETPFLQDFENATPSFNIHRRVASEREGDALVRAAQENAVAVEEEFWSTGGDFPEAAGNFLRVATGGRLKGQAELAEVRRKLAPEREVFVFEMQENGAACGIPLHGGAERLVDSRPGEFAHQSPIAFFARGIGNPHFGSSLGGIKLNAHSIDPNRRRRAELDFADDAVPD